MSFNKRVEITKLPILCTQGHPHYRGTFVTKFVKF